MPKKTHKKTGTAEETMDFVGAGDPNPANNNEQAESFIPLADMIAAVCLVELSDAS